VIGEIPEEPPEQPASLTQLDCALSYAALGKPVFPLKPDKKPYTKHGFKDASLDPAQIRAWWGRWPDAGIGIPTGKASGWLVLDIDVDKGGDASLSALVEQHGDLPPTPRAKTPSGGDHFFFKNPTDVEVRNSESKIGKGIDIRGEGGYVGVPGCDSSRRWVVVSVDEAEMPAYLRERAVASKKREPVKTDRNLIIYPLVGASYFNEGERHSRLRGVAYGRWIHGWAENENDLIAQVLQVNANRCVPPLSEDEATGLAESAAQNFTRGERKQEVTA